jgi:hypothetical protein
MLFANRIGAVLLLPGLLGAATYWASPSGSDRNPGTQGAPFRTVAQSVGFAHPGDTIILMDGVYPADKPYNGGSTSGWLLNIDKSGAPGAPITLTAQNRGLAILDCGNGYNAPQTGCQGYIYFIGAAHWVLDGLSFANAYVAPIDMNSDVPAHDITIRHCSFTAVGRHYETGSYGEEGVYAGPGTYNLTFDGNTFMDIGRTGGDYISHDHGLYLHSSNTVITDNLFLGPITGWGVQTASGFSGLIANNTFAFHMTNNGGQIMLWDSAAGPVRVVNNIFYQPNDGFAVNTCGFTAPSCSIENNLVTDGTIGGAANCGGAPACSVTKTISANPQFVSAQAPYNFDMLRTSPAAGAGADVPQAATTWDGTPRSPNVHDEGAGRVLR